MKKGLYGLGIFILCMSFAGVAFALTNIETLGKMVYEDTDFSSEGNQSCQSCHHPNAGFADPENRISPMYRPTSEGSVDDIFGGRNAPPAAYAAYSPPLYWDPVEGLFFGGLFWDGRASGIDETTTRGLGAGPTFDPLADQAKGPFGNDLEMNLVDESGDGGLSTEEKVVNILKASSYAKLYKKVFGIDIWDEPVDKAYNNIALAISAFEKSTELNKFSSKFDKFSNEQGLATIMALGVTVQASEIKSTVYTQEEIKGFELFNGKALCSACHTLDNQPDGKTPTVFTDFSYDNLGIPVNPALEGEPTDLGLGEVSKTYEILKLAYSTVTNEDLPEGLYSAQQGKFKVSSLRNIAKTAPYGHNGFFPTLYDMVHFYNTRDCKTLGLQDPSVSEVPGAYCHVLGNWDDAEVGATKNISELGALGLTFEEEQKIVVFLETLTDE